MLKKIFSIGIILILISLTLIPATNCMKIKNVKKTENKKEDSCFRNFDLVVDFNKLEFDRCEKIGGENYAMYNAEYKIKNIGDGLYIGKPPIYVENNEDDAKVVDWWYERICIILPGRGKTYSREIKVKSIENVENDEERYFADHEAKMITLNGGGSYKSNPNSNIKFGKYWNGKSDYEPTLSHLLVSTPWKCEKNYQKISNQTIYYLKFNDLKRLPNIIKNERLGWVKELNTYLLNFTNNIEMISKECDEGFVLEIWDKLNTTQKWLTEVCNWFTGLLNGSSKSEQILTIFDNFNEIISKDIDPLTCISNDYYGFVINEVTNLIKSAYRLQSWISLKSWENPIKIKGKIEGVETDERITITCRDERHIYEDKDDGSIDNSVEFEFIVPSTPLYNEGQIFEPHKCNLVINGNKHDNKIKVNNILFYCFSNGTVSKTFSENSWDSDKKAKNDFLKNHPLISKIIDLLKNKKTSNNYNVNNLETQYIEYDGGPIYPDTQVVYYVPDQIIVSFKDTIEVGALSYFMGYRIIDIIPDLNAALLDVSGTGELVWDIIEVLLTLADVKYAEVNTICYGSLSSVGESADTRWGQNAINLDGAWSYTMGDSDVTIAFIDTGIGYHEDLKKPLNEIDFVEKRPFWDDNAQDDIGHGTKVAGVVFSKNNDKGITGVAPYCNYNSVKVVWSSSDSNGNTDRFLLAKGICYAARPKYLLGLDADIICISVADTDGMAMKPANILRSACTMARNVYHSLIVAAPIDLDVDAAGMGAPAAYDTTISVGSVDENLKRHSSPEGVDIVAPGTNIYTTIKGNKYNYVSGTSFAAAYVAGVAALYFSAKKVRNPDLDDIKSCEGKMKSTAKHLGDSKYYGAGLIDAFRLLKKPRSLVKDR